MNFYKLVNILEKKGYQTMSQNTKNVEPEYKDEGQILKPSTTEHPLYGKIVDACKTVYDPEIPVNIYDLGLIYTVEISGENDAKILMSLTAPGCPVAGEMPGWVSDAVKPIEGLKSVHVEIVWEPQWGIERMSDEARLELGFMQSSSE